MAAFKDELSAERVAALGTALAAVWTPFPRRSFVAAATGGLAERELSGRVALIAAALVDALPVGIEAWHPIVDALLESPEPDGWIVWPLTMAVAEAGRDRPATALDLLARLTERFSAEFAIRPLVERSPDESFATLRRWVDHPSEHVRRLVSEGTRPRLPWAPVLRAVVADPTPTIALLDRLVDDDSEYVRRSVANHLNDISRDHPDLAIEVATRWLDGAPHRDRLVRHGLRTLVKRGDADALGLLGFGSGDGVRLVAVSAAPATLCIGDAALIAFTLVADRDTRAVIDYVVHYQGAAGRKAGKVFKLTSRDLRAQEPVTIERRHRFEHVSIRRIRPGPHLIEVQVNGRVLGGVEIEVHA